MKTREIRLYDDNTTIGTCDMTDEQYQQYVDMSDSDVGTIRLGALPHAWYDLDDEYQDTHEDTAVYIGDA